MRGFLGLLDADVVENTPWTLPKGSRDLRSLRMLHNFRLRIPKRTPKGVNWAWVTCGSPVTTTKKKKRGKKPGMRRTYFRSVPLPVTWLCHFRPKDPTRTDMTQFSVAHAQNILPDRVTSGHMTDVTSGHVTDVTSGRTTSNVALSVPIYYCRGGDRNYLCNQCLSPLMLRVRISIRARCTTLCDKVCQWLATGRWFSPSPPVSSTNKTDRRDITEISLKMALNIIKHNIKPNIYRYWHTTDGPFQLKLIYVTNDTVHA
jgi:hypothetical protein